MRPLRINSNSNSKSLPAAQPGVDTNTKAATNAHSGQRIFPWNNTKWGRYHTKTITDDVNTWKRFTDHWPFVREIHRWPLDSPHNGAVMWSHHMFLNVGPNNLSDKKTNCRLFDNVKRSFSNIKITDFEEKDILIMLEISKLQKICIGQVKIIKYSPKGNTRTQNRSSLNLNFLHMKILNSIFQFFVIV